MKLRNKKTGEVVDLSIFGIELNIRKENQPIYRSLAELNEEWEDYKPKEPLLKGYPDEMRAIKAYGRSPLRFHRHARKGYSAFNFCSHYICFDRLFENLEDGETCSIAELCGDSEEEEWQ